MKLALVVVLLLWVAMIDLAEAGEGESCEKSIKKKKQMRSKICKQEEKIQKLADQLSEIQAQLDEEEVQESVPEEELEKVLVEELEKVTDEELEKVTDEELEKVTDEELEKVTDEELEKVTDEQLENVSDEELENVTDEQLEKVTDEQLEKVTDEQLENVSDEELDKVPDKKTEEAREEETEVKGADPRTVGGTASQSSTAWGGVAERGFDKNENSKYFYGRSCTHTLHENNPWWKVVFDEQVKVTKVKLVNRSDCCSDRLRNVRVTVDGKTCFEHDGPVGFFLEQACDSPISGTEVKVTLEGEQEILTLCEVVVS